MSASLPSVGSTQWLVEQGALSIVAAGAFLFRDRIKALVGENNESADGRTNNFFGSGREDCPTCEGTGYATCACTKWSNDGEGVERVTIHVEQFARAAEVVVKAYGQR